MGGTHPILIAEYEEPGLPGVSCVMKSWVKDVGQRITLIKRFTNALASLAVIGTLSFGAWTLMDSSSVEAGGETRTISFYHVHTKESLTVTYMQGGRYVPSAMKKVNRLLRDWRRNEVITIDPRTLDLVWELHADLGSRRPVNIVSGYRSPRTNAFLRKIGRKVAKKSQHMKGKAIDFYFPDVPTKKIRDSALVRRVGGVGYYRSSGGPTGFLHVDSGNVRHWGPGIGRSEMASIMRNNKGTIGKRLSRKGSADTIAVSSEDDDTEEKSGGLLGLITGKRGSSKKPAAAEAPAVVEAPAAPLEAAYQGDDDELAQWSEDAAAAGQAKVSAPASLEDAVAATPSTPKKTKLPKVDPADADGMAAMAQTAAVEELADGAPQVAEAENAAPKAFIIKPRLKPQDVMVMASALTDDVRIQPANAGPESQSPVKRKPSQVADTLGPVEDADSLTAEADIETISNASSKTSFDAKLREETNEEAPVIVAPKMASLDGGDISWWSRLFTSAEELKRREGKLAEINAELEDVMPKAAILGPDGSGVIGVAESNADGKTDLQVVNRDGKGNLPPMKLRLSDAAVSIEDLQ
jgi:uncharacterized protein YcbK (DUF882 family)